MPALAKTESPTLHNYPFPNESAEYRRARDTLLLEERELRRHIERVAAQRRTLPPGGEVPEDYVFAADQGPIRMSELFGDKSTLVTYSFMYGPEMERPCPSCTSVLSGLNGEARDIAQRIAFVAVAKSPMPRIRAFARERGWNDLRLVSSAGNSFNRDYHGETPDGDQVPGWNVFSHEGGRNGGGVRHRYGAELGLLPSDPGQHPRVGDLMWPLWNLLDLTPEGRGTDWMPALSYGCKG